MKRYQPLFESTKITAYHGSPYNFDSFDVSKSGASNDPGDYGEGIYFDTNKDWARAYAQSNEKILYTCELNLKKFYEIDFKPYSDFKYKQDKRETEEGEVNEELEKYMDTLRKGGLNIKEVTGRYDKRGEMFSTFLGVSRAYGSKNITKAFQKQGYDAVVVNYGGSKEIVVFDTDAITIVNKEKL